MLKLDEHLREMDHAFWLADVAVGTVDERRACQQYEADIRAARARLNDVLARHGLAVVSREFLQAAAALRE